MREKEQNYCDEEASDDQLGKIYYLRKCQYLFLEEASDVL
jgi:hypothetical protein